MTPCNPCPTPGQITLGDLKRCGLAGEFFDAFFNADKFLEHERREPAGPVRVGGASCGQGLGWAGYWGGQGSLWEGQAWAWPEHGCGTVVRGLLLGGASGKGQS